ncbi:hypothetical protein [Pleomorphovibrio marinus]|uniref:hypothetical protein n=1 Tax=Pleomorphovibrio marinus TaxID=2164132 RepID=UPI000E0AA857|nr:hypothetical protein [Pleomorphovibrio marinus]
MRSWINLINRHFGGYWIKDKNSVKQYLSSAPYYCALDSGKQRELRFKFDQFLAITTFPKDQDLTQTRSSIYTVAFVLSCLTMGFKKLPNKFPQSIELSLSSRTKVSLNSTGNLVVQLDLNGSWVDDPFELIPPLARVLRFQDHFMADRSNPWSRPTRFQSFVALAEQEIKAIRFGEQSLLPFEAVDNFNELFIRCIYQFFDKPLELREDHPLLYQAMVILFMQDPALLYQKTSLTKV